MKLRLSLAVLLLVCIYEGAGAQISFKTEYIGSSNLLDSDGNRLDGCKGSALVYKAGLNLPLSTKVSAEKLPVVWGIGISGSYVSFHNKNIAEDLALSEVLGVQAAVYHIRPLNEKWYMMASIGLGIYTSDAKLSEIRYRNFLVNIGVLFVKKLKPNLEVGFGIAVNNTFGYPMLFPSLYFNWVHEGRFTYRLSMMDGGEMSLKYNANKKLSLSLIAEMSGQGAMLERNGKEMMFSHQYIVTGFRPEFKVSKYISIPLTIGVSMMRSTGYSERRLKGLFINTGMDADFQESFYLSGGVKIGFM